MTLVNFRRAICRLQLPRSATSGRFSARPHLNCSVNFAGPFSLIHRPRGRPRSETPEKENRRFLVRISTFLPLTMYRTLLPLLSALYHRSLGHSLFPPPAHTRQRTYTPPLQNFLTLRRYKYLQPRRRSSTTPGASCGRRTRAVDLCVGVSVLRAALVHTHMLSRRRCAALVSRPVVRHAIGRCMPSNPDRPRLRPLPVKGQNTLSNGEEKRSQYSRCIECTGHLTSGCLLYE